MQVGQRGIAWIFKGRRTAGQGPRTAWRVVCCLAQRIANPTASHDANAADTAGPHRLPCNLSCLAHWRSRVLERAVAQAVTLAAACPVVSYGELANTACTRHRPGLHALESNWTASLIPGGAGGA